VGDAGGRVGAGDPEAAAGSYFPSFLEPRRRSEQALVSVVQEAYVAGVSTRKVDQVVESLGLRISKSEVSRICAGLDEQVEAFRNRPLEGRYPYLWLDAKVEKVRDGGRVVRKCLVLAYAVHESGYREVIGLDVGCSKTQRKTCSPSTPSPSTTGRSCARPTRSSASTARSAAAPTSSASSYVICSGRVQSRG
jgi:hypothetical protein